MKWWETFYLDTELEHCHIYVRMSCRVCDSTVARAGGMMMQDFREAAILHQKTCRKELKY